MEYNYIRFFETDSFYKFDKCNKNMLIFYLNEYFKLSKLIYTRLIQYQMNLIENKLIEILKDTDDNTDYRDPIHKRIRTDIIRILGYIEDIPSPIYENYWNINENFSDFSNNC